VSAVSSLCLPRLLTWAMPAEGLPARRPAIVWPPEWVWAGAKWHPYQCPPRRYRPPSCPGGLFQLPVARAEVHAQFADAGFGNDGMWVAIQLGGIGRRPGQIVADEGHRFAHLGADGFGQRLQVRAVVFGHRGEFRPLRRVGDGRVRVNRLDQDQQVALVAGAGAMSKACGCQPSRALTCAQ